MERTVDTGTTSPQFAMSVWRSDEARYQPLAAFLFALLGILFGVAGIAGDETELAIGGFIGAALLLWLWRVLKRRARVELRIGCDRKADALWAIRSCDRTPGVVGDLSTVTELSLEKSSQMVSRYMGGPMGGPLHRASVRKDSWSLVVHRGEKAPMPLATFFAKKQATEALERAKALLSAQS